MPGDDMGMFGVVIGMLVVPMGMVGCPQSASQLCSCSISGPWAALICWASSVTRGSMPSLARMTSLISMAWLWCGIICWAKVTSAWLWSAAASAEALAVAVADGLACEA